MQLIGTAREPLNQLNDVIVACSPNTDVGSAERGIRVTVSLNTWRKSRKAVEKIKDKFLGARQNITLALVALNNLLR